MEEIIKAGRHIEIFRADNIQAVPVVYLNTVRGEGKEVWRECSKNCTLVCISTEDWNRDMSPWYAKKAFKSGEDFSGGAGAYLKLLENTIIPEIEAVLGFEVKKRGIAGYSLGGLFALYSIYYSKLFSLTASASGSLWFDGWMDKMRSERPEIIPERAYISIGAGEKRASDDRMRTVIDCCEEAADILRELGSITKYVINDGNHFKDTAKRTAAAIDFIAAVNNCEGK